jgi:acetyl-CoA carboxylase biotin carboxyl carrier protein
MDLNYIKKLVKLVAESGVDEIEIEEEGKKVRIAKNQNQAVAPSLPVRPPAVDITIPTASNTAVPHAPQPGSPQPSGTPATESAPKHHEVKSPIVGTFYRSPAPDASPFVQVGSTVEVGSVLCIVEAMKLMNEIESDVSGKIVRILAENGQPIEYDQTLFLVEPA